MTEARELRHAYVGTEHLLLGLLREGKNIAAQVLIESGYHARSCARRGAQDPRDTEQTAAERG